MSRTVLGKCPKCGEEVVTGKFGAYCKGKCGMKFAYAMGRRLSEGEIATLLAGKRILLRGLVSKKGNEYNAYISPNGIQDYSYEKDGETKNGTQWRFDMEFVDDEDLPNEGVDDGFVPVDEDELPFN